MTNRALQRLSADTICHQKTKAWDSDRLGSNYISITWRDVNSASFFILTDPKFLYPQDKSHCTRGKIVKCIRDKALQLGCQDSARWLWASYSISQIDKNKMILILCKPFVSFICKVGTITLPISSFWQWIKWLKCIEQCLVHCNWSININYHYYYY